MQEQGFEDDVVDGRPSEGAPAATAVAEPPAAFRDDDGGRVRSYEELEGNEGRSVFFRPHRYTAADLEPVTCAVELEQGDRRTTCALRDVSQNGVAFTWAGEDPPRQGQRLRITLRFDAYQAYRGDATIGSVRHHEGATVVGALFQDFLLDVDEVLQLREVRAWAGDGQGARLADRAWNVAGQDRFKALVAEMRLFLEDAEREFNALEERLPWHVLNGPPNPARQALRSRILSGFVSEMVRQGEAIDAALRQVPGGLASTTAREWALRNLDRYWMASPSCRWTKNKPFGYPGDYEVMGFLYERDFEGPTLFAKVMGLVFLSTRTAQAVRCRKDLVKRQILAMLRQRAGSGEPLRVLSVAAGPAQELYELFATVDELPAPLEVVLFEQDKNALAHAWRRLRSTAEARFPNQVRLTYLHDSVKRLLRDATLFQGFGRFDLVYSSGLLDYFQRNTGVVLTRRLAAAVKPGGHLLMANMVDHPTRWLMEWHLDWNLTYRTRQELLEIGHRAVPEAGLRILEEETGINPFFELTPH